MVIMYMPSFANYSQFVYINGAFLLLFIMIITMQNIAEIKENWVQYRCNPAYWVFSDHIQADMEQCVMTNQTNMMGYMLQPLTYITSNLTNMSGEITGDINGIREMVSYLRRSVSGITEKMFSVFMNMTVEFQKTSVSLKDMVGKMVGITMTLMYVLDGGNKTMKSAWNGPQGKLVRAIGSCFHESAPVKLLNGQTKQIKDVVVGDVLAKTQAGSDDTQVFATMKIDSNGEYLYRLKETNGPTSNDVYVTGLHYVYEQHMRKFIQVCHHPEAEKTDFIQPVYYCLITSTGKIPVGKYIFWDWEDDELNFKG